MVQPLHGKGGWGASAPLAPPSIPPWQYTVNIAKRCITVTTNTATLPEIQNKI